MYVCLFVYKKRTEYNSITYLSYLFFVFKLKDYKTIKFIYTTTTHAYSRMVTK